MQITCPKCHAEMRQYERSGIVIDQCTECRGVFLDRGELEKIIQGESASSGRSSQPQQSHTPPPAAYPAQPHQPQPGYGYPPPPPPPPVYAQPGYGHGHVSHGHVSHGYRHGHHGHGYRHGHYRRKGFLHDLFD
ncbi:zf-TFIIB domain-containing protein [Longispora sp. K20-0274]|uniref:TFIIB-type zinc ribbon-containing protein n=1 Tax=Longispora sp. K20-0274 TaxID=3088255 RepID=UPI00399A707B